MRGARLRYRFVSVCSFTMYSTVTDTVICSFWGDFQLADASYFLSFVASLDSTDQTRSANGVDWQEEVYQKVLYIKLLIVISVGSTDATVCFKLNKILRFVARILS